MQIAFARQTLALQRQSLEIATAKYKGGQTSIVDVDQGQSDVASTEALIEQNLIPLRQTANRLCVLLGIPAEDLIAKLGEQPIPTAPGEVIVGIPADLLRRRPDVRRAERQAAAQNAEVGVAIAALYPQISIGGSMGWEAQKFKELFGGNAFQGVVGPSFNWAILNYGRLLANIRAEDAQFQFLVTNYQNTVLKRARKSRTAWSTSCGRVIEAEDAAESVRTQMEPQKPLPSTVAAWSITTASLYPGEACRAATNSGGCRRPDRPGAHSGLSRSGRRLADPLQSRRRPVRHAAPACNAADLTRGRQSEPRKGNGHPQPAHSCHRFLTLCRSRRRRNNNG